MKRLLLLLANILFALSYAQTAQITYKVVIDPSEKEQEVMKVLKKPGDQASWSAGAEKLTFLLDVNGTNSVFYLQEGIQNKDLNAQMALSFIKYESPVYYTANQPYKYYNNKANIFFDNNEFIIEEPVVSDWKLENENKSIQGFTCYKAVATIQDNIPIVAWYCPELSFGFGPLGYGGLPGSILELQIGEALFGAIKISMKAAIEAINSNKLKGKKISKEEYLKIKIKRAKGI